MAVVGWGGGVIHIFFIYLERAGDVKFYSKRLGGLKKIATQYPPPTWF